MIGLTQSKKLKWIAKIVLSSVHYISTQMFAAVCAELSPTACSPSAYIFANGPLISGPAFQRLDLQWYITVIRYWYAVCSYICKYACSEGDRDVHQLDRRYWQKQRTTVVAPVPRFDSACTGATYDSTLFAPTSSSSSSVAAADYTYWPTLLSPGDY